MTGWRLGFAVGNPSAVKALGDIKTNIDSGVFQAIQYAGIAAYQGYDRPWRDELLATYRARRDALADGLKSMGWEVFRPRATFYVWIPTPDGLSSLDFASMLLDKADVVVTPGVGFGPSGEGFVRAALTVDEERIKEALRRLPRAVSALTGCL
jgi:LL-diaminopimelate aminotransferase